MHVTYDEACRQMYIYVGEKGAAAGSVHELLPWLRLDLTIDNKILGIEIDDPFGHGVDKAALERLAQSVSGTWQQT